MHSFSHFSITTAGSIGRTGSSAVVAVAIDRADDAAEEASIGRTCGTTAAA